MMVAGTQYQVPVTNAGESQFFEGSSALLPGGNVAVAWSNDNGPGTDEAIGVRVIRPDGSAITAELVDPGGAGTDRFPSVVAIDDTHFAVIYCNFSPDYVHIEIVGRVYTISGNTLVAGPVKTISDPVTADDNGNGLSATRLDSGEIVVAWGQYPPGSYSTATVVARTFSTNLDPLSPETQVSATNISSPTSFQISAHGDQVAVVWSQNQADGKVHALGSSFTVNSGGSIAPHALVDKDISINGAVRAMTTLANGDILVVYNGGPVVGGSLDDYDKLFGKIYGPGFTGNPVAFQINETVVDTGTGLADVVAFESGGFAVYWSQIPGGNKSELYTRTYDKNYQAATAQTQVNVPNGVNDNSPSAVVDDQGNVTLIWEQEAAGTPSRVIVASVLKEQDPDAQGPKIEGDKAISVLEGQTVVLTTSDVTVTNAGKAPDQVVYNVTAITVGTLLVDGVESYTFTQADLEAGKVSFRHNGSEFTTASITVMADFSSDPAVSAATINVSVTPVNDQPTVTFAQDPTAVEDVSYAIQGITVGDPDAASLTVTLQVGSGILFAQSGAGVTATQVAPGEVRLVGSVSSIQQFLDGGSVKFQTAPNSTASTLLTVTATDGALSDIQTKTITVMPVNDQPTITHSGPSTKAEDMPMFFTDIMIADPDGTNGPATVTISVSQGSLLFPANFDGVTISGTQTVQTLVGPIDKINAFLHSTSAAYMSPADMNGTVNVTVTADDGLGGTPTTVTYPVTVTPTNDAPVIGGDLSVTVPEGGTYVLTIADLSAADIDGDLVSFTVTALPPDMKVMIGTQEVSSFTILHLISGQVSIVNGSDATAAGTISLTVNDGHGSHEPLSIAVTVDPVNDAPQASNGSVTVAEDGSRAFQASDFTFADVIDVPANALSAVVITTLPSLGALTFEGNAAYVGQVIAIADIGKLVYAPASDGNGASYAEIGFRLRDDGGTLNGGSDTSTEVFIRIDVVPVADAPTSSDRTVSLNEDAAYTFSLADFAFADAADGASPDALTWIVIDTLPTKGGLTFDGQPVQVGQEIDPAQIAKLQYLPDADGFGTGHASFTFKVKDDGDASNGGDGTSVAYTVTFDVNPVNDAPTAVADGPISVDEGGSVTASVLTGVLSNDTDADHDALSVTDVKFGAVTGTVGTALAGVYGTLVLNADGSYSYASDNTAARGLASGQTGTDVFTYTVADGNGGTATATITFMVNGTTLLVEGVKIATRTVTNADGSQTQTLTVPTVADGGADGLVNIPIATNSSGVSLLSASVPVGASMEIVGSPMAKGTTASRADLLKSVQDHTAVGSDDRQTLSGGALDFLSGLPGGETVLVQTITLNGVSGQPISITGAQGIPGAPTTAVVIDASGLPSGTVLSINDVDFVAVIGAVRVTGGNGSQTAYGDGSGQWMVLGADDDVLHGGGGDDYVGSLGGNDRLYGDEGNDTVSGGEGNDTLDGGTGTDLMIGGTGSDTYMVDMASDVVRESKGQGTDTVHSSVNYVLTANVENLVLQGSAHYGHGNGLANVIRATDNGSQLKGWGGNDTLYGGAGVDRLQGSTGNDKLYGRAGNDYLVGDSGNDALNGGDGRDTINGGNGNDVIYGGLGKDTLDGGYGRDTFVFDTTLGKGEVDTIKHFRPLEDVIRLENAVFTKVGGKGSLDWDAFHVGKKAADAQDRIIYDAKSGALYYDKDGTGGAAQVQFAKIDKHLNLYFWDFKIV